MYLVRLVLIALIFNTAFVTAAQATTCVGNPDSFAPGYLRVTPQAPLDNQTLTITVGRAAYFYYPLDLSVQVHGNAIDATLRGRHTLIGLPPPIFCVATTLGPLPPGMYTVNAHLIDLDAPSNPSLIATTSVTVATDPTQGTPLCARPTISGPVYISFDATYSLYTTQLRLAPDGHNYVFDRHDVINAELAMLCAEGFDIRAVGDSPALGEYFPQAIEFYHAGFDHYFVAVDPGEIHDLDTGVHPGWTRTSQHFRVYVTDFSSPAILAPSCRFYGLPGFGLNSHFFSAFARECLAVQTYWPDRWILETSDAFRVHLPDVADGSCHDGSVPLYRLYNNRADANHRYTTSLTIRQQLIDRSWMPEGYGPLGVAMCVRPF